MNTYENILAIGKKHWKAAAIVGTCVGMLALGTKQVKDTSFMYRDRPIHIENVEFQLTPSEQDYVQKTYHITATCQRSTIMESALETLTLIDYNADGKIDVVRGWARGHERDDLRARPGSVFYELPDSLWQGR